MKFTNKILLILLLLPAPALRADTLANALSLFQFAETTYPELLSPPQPAIQEIQGFYVRYYSDTEIYLGVRGDDIYAIGGSIGPDLNNWGKCAIAYRVRREACAMVRSTGFFMLSLPRCSLVSPL